MSEPSPAVLAKSPASSKIGVRIFGVVVTGEELARPALDEGPQLGPFVRFPPSLKYVVGAPRPPEIRHEGPGGKVRVRSQLLGRHKDGTVARVQARLLFPEGHHLADGGFDLLPRSAGDVRPADASRQDEVAHYLVVTHHERDRPGRVTRRVKDPDTKARNVERAPVFERLVVPTFPSASAGCM